jgi:hypothetical protein
MILPTVHGPAELATELQLMQLTDTEGLNTSEEGKMYSLYYSLM